MLSQYNATPCLFKGLSIGIGRPTCAIFPKGYDFSHSQYALDESYLFIVLRSFSIAPINFNVSIAIVLVLLMFRLPCC